LALGAIVLGSLTAPGPEAAPETTTTTTPTEDVEQPIDLENFTIAEIERGPSLEWEQVHSVDDGYPMALLEHEGWTYLFATDVPDLAVRDEGGLRAWRSTDGLDWEALGQVITSGHVMTNVRSTGQGLIAIEGGTGGGSLTLWRSIDGVTWSSEPITVSETGEHVSVYAFAFGGNAGLLVVAARTGLDVPGLIEERLELDLDFSNYGWSPNSVGGEHEFVLWGPMGLPLLEVSADDLGLTGEQQELLEAEYNGYGPGFEVWVSAEPGLWLAGEIPDASWIDSITATPNGQIVATGWDNQANVVWTTTDGFDWEKTIPRPSGPYQVEVWNGRLIGPSDAGHASVVTSTDGLEWQRIGPEEHLPFQMQWDIVAMGSGPGGIAGTIHGWRSSTSVPQDEPAVLTDGDATLTIDYNTGSYQVESGDITRTWSMNSSQVPDGVIVDIASERVTFHAVDTDDVLASFTFDQLTQAEAEFWSHQGLDDQYEGLVFSPNGEEWTIQDPSRFTDGSIRFLEVNESHVVAAVIPEGGRFSPQMSPGFEIWSAPILMPTIASPRFLETLATIAASLWNVVA
jgi:hypothetical protein